MINKSTFSESTPQELDVPERTQETPAGEGISEEIQEHRNEEISINYTGEMWNREEIIIDDTFSNTVATEMMIMKLIVSMIVDKGMIGLNEKKQFKKN